jgi:hypothetical protein
VLQVSVGIVEHGQNYGVHKDDNDEYLVEIWVVNQSHEESSESIFISHHQKSASLSINVLFKVDLEQISVLEFHIVFCSKSEPRVALVDFISYVLNRLFLSCGHPFKAHVGG